MVDIQNGNKWCGKCGKYVAVAEFSPSPTTKDKLRVYCKKCCSELTQAYHATKQKRRNQVTARKPVLDDCLL